ncbi:MAG: HlyD family efflux transporter periplasmic adaptor subunit [Ruthenibacterium sp.]
MTEKASKKRGIWIWILLLIPTIYIIVQLFAILNNSYQTQTVVEDVLADSISCKGILGMTETAATYEGGGVLGYVAKNGERVKAGNLVAEVFADKESAQNSAYVQQLTDEITLLTKAQTASANADAEMLLKEMYAEAYDVLDILQNGVYENLRAVKYDLQAAIGKTQIVTGESTGFADRIAALTAQRDAMLAGTNAAQVLAPVTGYFVAAEDSVSRLYTTEQLQAMTPTELESAADTTPPLNEATVAGKLIADYKWRYFACVSEKQGEKFKQCMDTGSTIYVAFTELSDEQVPAKVVNVTIDAENNLAKIEILCDYINESVVTLEHAQATLTFRNYNGICINKEALRVKDGVKGVYVKYGNLIKFRKIDVLYENDTYLLAPKTYTKDVNEVKMYDEVILSGKNLADGKTI